MDRDYYDDDYPCDTCGWADECDGWEASVCPMLNDYLGIDDYDPSGFLRNVGLKAAII